MEKLNVRDEITRKQLLEIVNICLIFDVTKKFLSIKIIQGKILKYMMLKKFMSKKTE